MAPGRTRGGSRPRGRAPRPVEPVIPDEAVRLQKLLAQAGIASRRAAEGLITGGRVTVNGAVVTELGTKVNPARARIEVDGRRIDVSEAFVYVLMNKPRGTISTARDPEGRERVSDLIREKLPRVWTVGRLDVQTSGAILLTNDGDLTNALTHPSHQVERVYHVKVRDELGEKARATLEEGVTLDDGERAEAVRVVLLGGDDRAWWYRFTLHEGRYHEVRRMMEAVGAQVQKLHRMEFAGLTVDNVRPAHYRFLAKEEVKALYGRVGLTWRENLALWRPPAPPRSAPKKGGRPPRKLPTV